MLNNGILWKTFYDPGTAWKFGETNNWDLFWRFAPGLFHVIDYSLTVPDLANINKTNVNSRLTPQSITVGLVTYPPPSPSDRVLDACATLRSGGGSWNIIPGGYTFPWPGGVNWPHTSAHLKGTLPAGGNAGYLDGHVAWKKFEKMLLRTNPGANPQFWW
jgi:prepilin-type processing-associated H-X9-DG protein